MTYDAVRCSMHLDWYQSLFFGSQKKDFGTNQDAWNTLLHRTSSSLKRSIPPLLDSFFLSWSLTLDPIALPTLKRKSTASASARTRFQEEEEEESEHSLDVEHVLPFCPC